MKVKCFGFLAASVAIALLVTGGCVVQSKLSVGGGDPGSSPEKAKSPEERLYEQVRSGAFQLTSALESLQKAMTHARTLSESSKGDLKEAMLDVVDHMDAAGAVFAEYASAPEKLEEFKKAFAEHDNKRLKAIEAANSGLTDTDEADGILDSLLERAEFKDNKGLLDLSTELGVVIDSLESAIKEMGGKVEDAGAAPETPVNPPKP